MERVEAFRVLGLEEGATVESVRRAYRRLATGYEQLRLVAATPEMEREVKERLRLLLAAVLPAGLPVWDEDVPGAGLVTEVDGGGAVGAGGACWGGVVQAVALVSVVACMTWVGRRVWWRWLGRGHRRVSARGRCGKGGRGYGWYGYQPGRFGWGQTTGIEMRSRCIRCGLRGGFGLGRRR